MGGLAVAITALAGVASGLLFLSTIEGGGLLPLAGYFVQLPLLLCGLTMGPLSAGLASAGALLVVLLASGLAAALVLLVVQLAPAVLVSRQALLWRTDASGARVWYPLGLLARDGALFVGAASLLGLLWLEWTGAGVDGLLRLLAAHLAAELAAPGAAPGLRSVLDQWRPWIPGLVALSWLGMIWSNAALAQALASRSGRALRPSPRLAELELPRACVPAAVAALLLVQLGSGTLAYLAAIVLALSAALLFLAGLAVVHTLVARRRLGTAPLVGFYLVLVLFSWPLVLVIVALGLIEELAGLRRRLV